MKKKGQETHTISHILGIIEEKISDQKLETKNIQKQ
jgi:hypothetical protein